MFSRNELPVAVRQSLVLFQIVFRHLLPFHFLVQVEQGLALLEPVDYRLQVGRPDKYAAVEVRVETPLLL